MSIATAIHRAINSKQLSTIAVITPEVMLRRFEGLLKITCPAGVFVGVIGADGEVLVEMTDEADEVLEAVEAEEEEKEELLEERLETCSPRGAASI